MTDQLARLQYAAPPRAHTGLLGRLSVAERAALQLMGRAIRIPAGSSVMTQGERADRIVILTAGHAKLTRTSTDGRDALIGLRDPGDLIGHQALTGLAWVDAAATALTDVEGLVISRAALTAHLDRSPRLLLAMLEAVSEECVDAARSWAERSRLDTLGRVASCLIELADRYGRPHQGGVTITLPLRQDDLVAWTGASRAGTSNALRTLRELGWIRTARAQIIVADLDALRHRATA